MKRRKLDFRTMDAAIREVDRLRGGGYSKAGNWDLAQVCHHLQLAMNRSIDGTEFRAHWIIRRFFGPVVKRRLLRTRFVPIRVSAPPGVVPPIGLDEAQAVGKFKTALDRVFDVTAAFGPHPIFGPMTADEWRQFHLIHASHHLGYLLPQDRIVV